MSSAEEEYLGACNAAMALAHLKMLLFDFENIGKPDYNDLSEDKEVPPVLLVDNQATVNMARNFKPTKKCRHIARRYHYLREGERNKLHQLRWIPKEDQLADDLTKTQSEATAKPHVKRTLVELNS